MMRILYSSPFVPPEWIAAHGCTPVRLTPSLGGEDGQARATQEGVCPYAQGFAQEALAWAGAEPGGEQSGKPDAGPNAAAIVFAPLCDQMRRMADRAATGEPDLRPGAAAAVPIFAMHVPRTWQTAAARDFYRDELRRLGRFLVRLGGHEPTPAALAEAMRVREGLREALRRAQAVLPGRVYAEMAMALERGEDVVIGAGGTPAPQVRDAGETHAPQAGGTPAPQVREAGGTPAPQTGEAPAPQGGATTAAGKRIALALVGGPLSRQHLPLFDCIEQAGGRVVLDATESGERGWPRPFDAERLAADPFEELADAYFEAIPDAARRPNSGLYQWLRREMEARGVRGIVFHHYVWCDLWHAEAERLREWAGLPVVVLEWGHDATPERTRTAVEALLEALR